MIRLFDHLDLRVRDKPAALEFYHPVARALGFPHFVDGDPWFCFCSVPYPEVGEYLAITEDRSHVSGRTCHAFWKPSRAEVDALATELRAIQVPDFEPPEMYYRGHYAFYFADPTGNRFEVCYREYSHAFDSRILTNGS
jgi:catechol 2,3-dioxygenase-like lactoylglutathione lyase family enzyme